MVRPKHDYDNKRVIIDLIYLPGASLNAGLRKGQYQGLLMSYTLTMIIDLADEITCVGNGAFIWCVDLAVLPSHDPPC